MTGHARTERVSKRLDTAELPTGQRVTVAGRMVSDGDHIVNVATVVYDAYPADEKGSVHRTYGRPGVPDGDADGWRIVILFPVGTVDGLHTATLTAFRGAGNVPEWTETMGYPADVSSLALTSVVCGLVYACLSRIDTWG